MDLNSPEIQKMLAAITERTQKGLLSWKVPEYDPIGFMTEMGVEFDGSETENFAQNITFLCHLKKGRTIWLETYESIGFPSPNGFPAIGDGLSLRGLGYYTIRFLSSFGRTLFQAGCIIRDRREHLLLCLLADAVFADTQEIFRKMPENNPARFCEYLHSWDESGGLEHQPISMLMTDFYQYNRCMDFHLLAMSCATGLRKLGGNHP